MSDDTTTAVKRYGSYGGWASMIPAADGDWVQASDYDALAAQLAEVRAERDRLRKMERDAIALGVEAAEACSDRDRLAAEVERMKDLLKRSDDLRHEGRCSYWLNYENNGCLESERRMRAADALNAEIDAALAAPAADAKGGE